MCLILFAHDVHPAYSLVIAANRDESFARPSAAAAFWDDHPDILGGRDLEQGGTWLGLTRSGRLAAITNFRQSAPRQTGIRSRGALASDFLRGSESPADYLDALRREAEGYNGFNLLAGTITDLHYYSNRTHAPQRVSPGIHGLSNALLDTPWPKVQTGKARLEALLQATDDALVDGLFAALADRAVPADPLLPDTGVGVARERNLAPAFITGEHYGTRCSTVLLVDRDGRVRFHERTFAPDTSLTGTAEARFELSA